VGKRVMRAAAEGIKRVSLELGGKSACLVFADADLEACVPSAMWSALDNAGQDCCARSRFLVEAPVYEKVTAMLAEAVSRSRAGLPRDPETEMGPLITPEHRDRVRSYVTLGESEGAVRVCGGAPPAGAALEAGNYLAPCVLAGATSGMRVAREEI